METINDYQKCNEILANYKGAKAKIWTYDKIHGRLIIRLWRYDKVNSKVQDEIFISALSCEYISGNFIWDNINLKIIKESDKDVKDNLYKLVDLNNQFTLISTGGIGIIKDIVE